MAETEQLDKASQTESDDRPARRVTRRPVKLATKVTTSANASSPARRRVKRTSKDIETLIDADINSLGTQKPEPHLNIGVLSKSETETTTLNDNAPTSSPRRKNGGRKGSMYSAENNTTSRLQTKNITSTENMVKKSELISQDHDDKNTDSKKLINARRSHSRGQARATKDTKLETPDEINTPNSTATPTTFNSVRRSRRVRDAKANSNANKSDIVTTPSEPISSTPSLSTSLLPSSSRLPRGEDKVTPLVTAIEPSSSTTTESTDTLSMPRTSTPTSARRMSNRRLVNSKSRKKDDASSTNSSSIKNDKNATSNIAITSLVPITPVTSVALVSVNMTGISSNVSASDRETTSQNSSEATNASGNFPSVRIRRTRGRGRCRVVSDTTNSDSDNTTDKKTQLSTDINPKEVVNNSKNHDVLNTGSVNIPNFDVIFQDTGSENHTDNVKSTVFSSNAIDTTTSTAPLSSIALIKSSKSANVEGQGQIRDNANISIPASDVIIERPLFMAFTSDTMQELPDNLSETGQDDEQRRDTESETLIQEIDEIKSTGALDDLITNTQSDTIDVKTSENNENMDRLTNKNGDEFSQKIAGSDADNVRARNHRLRRSRNSRGHGRRRVRNLEPQNSTVANTDGTTTHEPTLDTVSSIEQSQFQNQIVSTELGQFITAVTSDSIPERPIRGFDTDNVEDQAQDFDTDEMAVQIHNESINNDMAIDSTPDHRARMTEEDLNALQDLNSQDGGDLPITLKDAFKSAIVQPSTQRRRRRGGRRHRSTLKLQTSASLSSPLQPMTLVPPKHSHEQAPKGNAQARLMEREMKLAAKQLDIVARKQHSAGVIDFNTTDENQKKFLGSAHGATKSYTECGQRIKHGSRTPYPPEEFNSIEMMLSLNGFAPMGMLFVLMDILKGHEEGLIHVNQLAQALRIGKPSLLAQLENLEAAGLLRTISSSRAGRHIELLTPNMLAHDTTDIFPEGTGGHLRAPDNANRKIEIGGQFSYKRLEMLHRYLEKHGISVVSIPDESDMPSTVPQISAYMGKYYQYIQGFYERLKITLSLGEKFDYCLANQPSRDITHTLMFCRMLHEAGFLSKFEYHRAPTYNITAQVSRDPAAINFLTGGWLEHYVRDKVISVLTTHPVTLSMPYAFMKNPNVMLPGNEPFELDFLLYIGEKIFWIESKTGAYMDFLPKYSRVSRLLGLTRSTSMLVSVESLNTNDRLTSRYNLSCCNLDEFPDVFRINLVRELQQQAVQNALRNGIA